jgi:acetoin utilization deacetylase AcuC-like enzyme
MRVSYCEGYYVELPEGHPFPMRKFPALFEILTTQGLIGEADATSVSEASWHDLALVHTAEYLDSLRRGNLDRQAERKMGLPWSCALVRRSRLAVQGTVNASRMALEDGVAANLAGGTHHAFAGHGEGFCVLNDVAVAIRALRREGRIERALVIDLDVHQGNGTAAICQDDPHTYTFSMHGERNYPFAKAVSTLDVALPDATTDEPYLQQLAYHLPQVIAAAAPDLIFFLAGVDPVSGDRYGRLDLSREGIRERERLVLRSGLDAEVPMVLLLSGGYAETPEATADLHAEVHREYRRICGYPGFGEGD